MLSYAVVSVQWIIFGFSLAFSETGGSFIGNFDMAGMTLVGSEALSQTAPQVSAIAFALLQLQVCAVTVAIVFGSASDRARLLPALLFIFVWSTLVYDFANYWVYGAHGWLRNLSCLNSISDTPCGIGVLDFAGAGPVHMLAGFSGLAYAIVVGKRQVPSKPHNLTNVFLGTALLWLGWFTFNSAGAIGSTARASMAAFVTAVAGGCGALGWITVDSFREKRIRFTILGFCCGVLAGLVCITPGSGYVAPWASIIIGFTGGIVCNFGCQLKYFLQVDDALDAFGFHGVGGITGALLTGIFAQKWVAALDGTVINGGLVDGNGLQIAYQLAEIFSCSIYAFVLTFSILFIINLIPGLKLRTIDGTDSDYYELGEHAYEIVNYGEMIPLNQHKIIGVSRINSL